MAVLFPFLPLPGTELCKIQTTKEPATTTARTTEKEPPKCAPFPRQCYFINEITQFPLFTFAFLRFGSVQFGFPLFNDDARDRDASENRERMFGKCDLNLCSSGGKYNVDIWFGIKD